MDQHHHALTYNYHLQPASTAPWLHQRTRKRVRDNRPSSTQIHADTVRKLFDAQRVHISHQDDAMMLDDTCPYTSSKETPYVAYDDLHSSEREEMEQDTLPPSQPTPPSQRRIRDFFAPRPQSAPHSSHTISIHPRSPTPQEISAGAPAPVLRERSSMGVLGGMNTPSPTTEGVFDLGQHSGAVQVVGAGMNVGAVAAVAAGSCLPIDFRSAALLQWEGRRSEVDAMVMG